MFKGQSVSNNLSQQKRILIAVVLSFLFFVVYDYFFIPKAPITEQNITKNEQNNSAPQTNHAKQAPKVELSVNQKDEIALIKSEHFQAHIDSLGRISKFYLSDEKFKDENGKSINLVDTSLSPLPLEIRFSDNTINQEAFNTPYTANQKNIEVNDTNNTLILTQHLNNLIVTKKITFYKYGNYDIEVNLSKDIPYFITPGYRPNIAVDSYTLHGVLTLNKDDKINILEDGDVKNDENFANVTLMSAFDRYYSVLFYNFKNPINAVVTKDTNENSVIFASANGNFKANGYIGSKEHEILRSIDPRLDEVVEYGWFTFIAKPMFEFLNFLHGYMGNWGWAIVIMTLIVRIILFPLTYKSMISMNKLKDLAPKMKEIRDRYKGDPQKMNIHMMELYKKHGANPMSGCLPILIQIPIFFAIYRVLLNAIELKAAPWAFWITDLSVMDPWFVLPIFMGITMFIQQLITPMTIQDPMQAKIMKFLPLIFTFFFLTFPAGLTLYWCVNNICSLIQQVIVNKLFKNHKQEEIAKHEHRS
ncbi:membrane protein insertase YidC [Campylobacter insulaenigrae]|uniref:membrane protein insertase YidC n=1 Tax=Campylobacter insulaenigrae TaxID=260714 RepID=UPI0021C35B61|nr:membrane protein insertase YidC [Campylobacter insulaenigrae]